MIFCKVKRGKVKLKENWEWNGAAVVSVEMWPKISKKYDEYNVFVFTSIIDIKKSAEWWIIEIIMCVHVDKSMIFKYFHS